MSIEWRLILNHWSMNSIERSSGHRSGSQNQPFSDRGLSERHLRKAVKEYTEHYHLERNHQGLDNQLIEKPGDEVNMDGAVQCREGLGVSCTTTIGGLRRRWARFPHTTG
jgi:hypothetical protein